MNLADYEARIKKMVEPSSQTVNVTSLAAIKEILKAVDKWRRLAPDDEVAEGLLQSIFLILATCSKLNHKNSDLTLKKICKSQETLALLKDKPNDVIWSFLIYESPPHCEVSKESQYHDAQP